MNTSGSLCSGYGGLDLAADLALGPLPRAWHSEILPAGIKVLEQHWPEVPNLGDITAVDWSRIEDAARICAGVPCQPVSYAGAKRGQDDHRWLWPYAFQAVRTMLPAEFIFENVTGLTGPRHRHLFDGILADLQGIGYDVRWCVLGACTVGACHHRHRVFVLALHTKALVGPDPVRVDVATCGAPIRAARRLLPTPVARDGEGRGEGSEPYWDNHRERTGRTNGRPLGTVVRLLPTPLASDSEGGHRRAREGRIAGPNGADYGARLRDIAGRLLPTPRVEDGQQRATPGQLARKAPGLAAIDGLLPNGYQTTVDSSRWGEFAEAVTLWSEIHGPVPEPTEIGPRAGHRLSAELPEWMMGLPPGFLTDHCTRTEAITLAGNGVMPQQGAAALALLAAYRRPERGRRR